MSQLSDDLDFAIRLHDAMDLSLEDENNLNSDGDLLDGFPPWLAST